ncbi:SH3-like domain-containing protein [Pelagibius sp. Alg239-R121]|uniref:SH3-like domain-containing protein n=1 Tax=Pelagibius sp. Alg239-R121 TaxID=2993448 RepID=UPI0024A71952|nr:SH3-like domain-containing protein [Pelagibius sp. Alg239-R121]
MTHRFPIGARVSVSSSFPPGHVRTPFFVRGKTGIVTEVAGEFPNPEELAYGRDGLPARTLFRVTFLQQDLWPDYAGGAGDTTVVDIFEHWLQEADASEGAAGKGERAHV